MEEITVDISANNVEDSGTTINNNNETSVKIKKERLSKKEKKERKREIMKVRFKEKKVLKKEEKRAKKQLLLATERRDKPRRDNNTITLNKEKYSVTTTKVQNTIRRIVSSKGLKLVEVDEKDIN